jgi:hypothetical protein
MSRLPTMSALVEAVLSPPSVKSAVKRLSFTVISAISKSTAALVPTQFFMVVITLSRLVLPVRLTVRV